MANEFKHLDPGGELTQAEFIASDGTGHIVDSQATGDILYASSSTVLKGLAKGSNDDVLSLAAGIPAWTSSPSLTALTVDDVAVNGKIITMTGSSGDTAVFTVGTNGTLSLVTVDTAASAANIQITADGTVDIDSAGVLTLDSGAAINIEPAAGSAVLIDGNVSIDGDAVTGIATLTASGVITAGGFTIGSAAILEAELEILDGALVTTAELNIIDGGTSATSTTIADADRVVLNDNGTMVQAAVTDLKTYIGAGPSQADQEAIEGEDNEDEYVPPDLLHFGPWAIKCHIDIPADGSVTPAAGNSYGIASVGNTGTGDRDVNFTTAFTTDTYTGVGGTADGTAGFLRFDTATTGDCRVVMTNTDNSAAAALGTAVAFMGDFA